MIIASKAIGIGSFMLAFIQTTELILHNGVKKKKPLFYLKQ